MTAQRGSDNKPSRRWQMPDWHARFPRDRAPTRGLVGPHHRSVGHGVLGQLWPLCLWEACWGQGAQSWSDPPSPIFLRVVNSTWI